MMCLAKPKNELSVPHTHACSHTEFVGGGGGGGQTDRHRVCVCVSE